MVNLATKLTIVRLSLILPVLIFLFIPPYRWIACVLFVAVAVLDSLDGYLARRRNEVTRLGTILDPTADKITVFILLIALPSLYSYFPYWFSFLLIGRELLVVGGWGLHYYLTGNPIIIPSKLGKLTMVIQYITIALAVLMSSLYAYDIDPLAGRELIPVGILFGVSFLTIFTTVDYSFNLIHHGFKTHPDTISPLEHMKSKRDIKRAMKNKPPAKRRVMKHIYKRTAKTKEKPRYKPVMIRKFDKLRTCQICQGSMKNEEVVQCECSRFFHRKCMETMGGECPRCGTVIDVRAGMEYLDGTDLDFRAVKEVFLRI